jgi:hypothetical protein
MRIVVRYLRVALIVEAVVVPVVLLSLIPHWPKTWFGWALVLLAGPPLWFLVGGVSAWAREIIPGDSVATAVYGVVILLLLLGGYVLFSLSLGDYLRPQFH